MRRSRSVEPHAGPAANPPPRRNSVASLYELSNYTRPILNATIIMQRYNERYRKWVIRAELTLGDLQDKSAAQIETALIRDFETILRRCREIAGELDPSNSQSYMNVRFEHPDLLGRYRTPPAQLPHTHAKQSQNLSDFQVLVSQFPMSVLECWGRNT